MTKIPSQTLPKFDDLISKANWEDFFDEIDPIEQAPIEGGIQVDFLPEKTKAADPQERKKQKKKEYKKRKREKDRFHEKQAKIELATIIEQIYCQRTTFEGKKSRIEICLSYLDRGEKFHDFLNQVIRIHINSVQREIWQHTQELLSLHPVERNDSSTFYYEFAYCLCLGYEHICKATVEIKKIIRFFMLMTENKDYLGPKHRSYKSLERDTFAYLIESDLSLKSLIRICEKKLETRTELNKLHSEEVTKLVALVYQLEIDIDSESQEQYEESTATSFDDDEALSFATSEQEEGSMEAKRKPKRKRKVRESDLKPDFQDVLRRIQSLSIDLHERMPCNVQEQWLQHIEQQIASEGRPRKKE